MKLVPIGPPLHILCYNRAPSMGGATNFVFLKMKLTYQISPNNLYDPPITTYEIAD